MLQNSRVTAFIVFELLRETNWGGGVISPPTQIRVNTNSEYLKIVQKNKQL